MSSSISMLSLNEDVRMVHIGIGFIVLSVFIPPLFTVLMKTIYVKDKHSSNMTFKLMNLVLFFQLLQGLGHFISSPVLIYPTLLQEFKTTITIIGCMMNTSWIGEIPMLSILSVCRALIFAGQMQSRKMSRLVKILVFTVLSWTAFVFVSGCLTQNIIYLSPGWEYDPEVPYSEMFGIFEIALTFPCLVVSYLSYVIITILIFKKKSHKSCINSRRNELRLLFQSTFITTYLTAMIIVWHQNLFPFVSFIDVTSKRNQAILNGLWILHCYINPVMIIIYNKPLREGCKKQLREWLFCSSLSAGNKTSNPLQLA